MVRKFLWDSLRMWIDEYHVNGFRFDSTSNIWNTNGGRGQFLPAGASWMQTTNIQMELHYPEVFRIAEDLTDHDQITRSATSGGLGFQAQWHWTASTLRNTVSVNNDGLRDMRNVRIDPADPASWQARKRSTLAAATAFCASGIPMLYQGQEFLDQQPFDPLLPIDWAQKSAHSGI